MKYILKNTKNCENFHFRYCVISELIQIEKELLPSIFINHRLVKWFLLWSLITSTCSILFRASLLFNRMDPFTSYTCYIFFITKAFIQLPNNCTLNIPISYIFLYLLIYLVISKPQNNLNKYNKVSCNQQRWFISLHQFKFKPRLKMLYITELRPTYLNINST